MRIGQLADLLGIQTQTIRFYEKKGLLPLPARSYNGYRVYTEKHYKRLKFVCSCRAIGLSLSETRRLQDYQDNPHHPCSAVNTLIDEHIMHIRSQITSLQDLEKQLTSIRTSCTGQSKVIACTVLNKIDEIESVSCNRDV